MRKRILPGLISLLIFVAVLSAPFSAVKATEAGESLELYSQNVGLSITFNSNGVDALNMPGTITGIAPGEIVSIPNPPRATGLAFEGWYLDSHCKIPYVFKNPLEQDVVLYAKWSGSQWDAPVREPVIPPAAQETEDVSEVVSSETSEEAPGGVLEEASGEAADEVVINHDDTSMIESDPVKTAEEPETWLYMLIGAFSALIIFIGFAFSGKKRTNN